MAALRQQQLDAAAELLTRAIVSGQVAAATLHVTQGRTTFSRAFGKAQSEQAMFLLGSISKPICMAVLMTLFDRAESSSMIRSRSSSRCLRETAGSK